MLGGGGPDKMEQAMAMAAQNPHLEAENTKDFLALWTKMAVTCFERCVTNTQNSMIDPNSKEFSCVENCVGKVRVPLLANLWSWFYGFLLERRDKMIFSACGGQSSNCKKVYRKSRNIY